MFIGKLQNSIPAKLFLEPRHQPDLFAHPQRHVYFGNGHEQIRIAPLGLAVVEPRLRHGKLERVLEGLVQRRRDLGQQEIAELVVGGGEEDGPRRPGRDLAVGEDVAVVPAEPRAVPEHERYQLLPSRALGPRVWESMYFNIHQPPSKESKP